MRRFHFSRLQIVTHLGAIAPLGVMIYDALAGNLSYNPIQDVTFRTGKTALVLLVLSLACTPLNTVFGFTEALKLRRPLGVYAFLYALMHFFIFVGVDYMFNPSLLYEAIVTKRYALIGLAAFLLLLPLALTSTKGWQRRLGQSWKKLHKLVYLAALLVIVHYVWLVKADIRTPLYFGAGIIALLVLRIPAVKRRLPLTWLRALPRRLVRLAPQRKGSAGPTDVRLAPKPAAAVEREPVEELAPRIG